MAMLIICLFALAYTKGTLDGLNELSEEFKSVQQSTEDYMKSSDKLIEIQRQLINKLKEQIKYWEDKQNANE
jgi:predicted small metal-binding protein